MKKISLLLATIALLAPTFGRADELPLPDGFSWSNSKATHAKVAKPEHWVTNEESGFDGPTPGSETSVVKITPKDGGNGKEVTGLSMSVTNHLTAEAAKKLVHDDLNPKEEGATMLVHSHAIQQPFVKDNLRYSYVEDGKQWLVQRTVVLNTKTNTEYCIDFRAPQAEWKNSWPQYGETLTRFYKLDPEF